MATNLTCQLLKMLESHPFFLFFFPPHHLLSSCWQQNSGAQHHSSSLSRSPGRTSRPLAGSCLQTVLYAPHMLRPLAEPRPGRGRSKVVGRERSATQHQPSPSKSPGCRNAEESPAIFLRLRRRLQNRPFGCSCDEGPCRVGRQDARNRPS